MSKMRCSHNDMCTVLYEKDCPLCKANEEIAELNERINDMVEELESFEEPIDN